MNFSQRLKELRKKHKITQESLAKMIGVERSSIGKYESSTTIPSNETLIKIANYFNVSIDYLLGNSPEEKQKPAENGEPLKGNVVIFHRDGKTVTKEFTEEQMDIIAKLLDEIPEKPKNV